MSAPRKTHLALLKKFFLFAKAFFTGGSKRQARFWLAILLGLCFAVGLVQVFLSYAMRDFVTALSQRDEAGWVRGLWKYVGIAFVSVPVGVFYRYSQERLSLAWRRWLTQHLIKRYFFHRAYYRIRASDSVDNPDQRIAEDAKLFTTGVLNFFLVIVNSVVTLVGFIGVLWTFRASSSACFLSMPQSGPRSRCFLASGSWASISTSTKRKRPFATGSCACAITRSRSPFFAAKSGSIATSSSD
jgi:putative ATP-binding cassette transporter